MVLRLFTAVGNILYILQSSHTISTKKQAITGFSDCASIADLIKELKEKVEILKNDLQDNVLDAKKVRDIENAMRGLEAAFNERDNVLMTVLGD